MASLTNADILEVDPNQVGKSVAVNTSLAAIDAMLGSTLSVDASMHATPYTLPYTPPDEPLGTKTALRFFFLTITGALTADWTVYMPASKSKFFAILNSTTGGHNVIIKVSGQTGVTVPAASQAFCFLNGTDVIGLSLVTTGGGVVNSVNAGTSITIGGTSSAPVVNVAPATIHPVSTGTSDSLSTLAAIVTQIIWRSTTAGAKSQAIPAAASWGGYDLDISFIGGVDPLTITPASGTIGGQASITLTNPGQTNLSLRADSANTDWIIR